MDVTSRLLIEANEFSKHLQKHSYDFENYCLSHLVHSIANAEKISLYLNTSPQDCLYKVDKKSTFHPIE